MKPKYRLWLLSILAMVLLAPAIPSMAAPRPVSAALSETYLVVDMAEEKTVQLEGSVLPKAASQRMVWKSGSTSIATVNSRGLVTLKKPGKVTVGVRPYGVNRWKKCTIVVKDSLRPTSMTLSKGNFGLRVGDALKLTAKLSPSTAVQDVAWKTSKSSVATVSQDGTVTAKKAGTALIRAISKRNSGLYRTIKVTVSKPPAPSRISITPATKSLDLKDTLELSATVSPSTASSGIRWVSSNTSIATVSSTGVVTPKKVGTVKIAARSSVKSSVYTIRTLNITNKTAPTSISIDEGSSIYVADGAQISLSVTVQPSTAQTGLSWTSSASSIVQVNADGKIKAVSPGTARITAKSTVGGLTDSITITVLDTTRTRVIPERATGAGGITTNLAKIDAVRLSAYNELNQLVASRQISKSDASIRQDILVNAFSMYRFPWTTDARVPYWTSAYNGQKDYLPGKVYYGMPYIQCGTNGSYTNRLYNVSKAISSGYYVKGDGYYKKTAKKLNGRYAGNDCSSFVSMSTWGMNHSASFLNTTAMASSSYYRTISDYGSLRPGDTLVKSGVHTVMFLYYTNAAKTQMMIIEQGGGGANDMHNTVTCSEESVAKYYGNGYRIRRANKLSK